MTRVKIVFVALMTIPLAGCLLSGKPKTVAATPAPPQPTAPATPAEPLSIPQTQVDLPAFQEVKSDALVTDPKVESAPPAPKPAATPPAKKSNAPPPAKPTDAAPPPDPAPEPEAVPTRPPIQEVLPPDAQKQLQDSAHKHRVETQALLSAAKPHTANQKRAKAEIDQFLKQSQQAETDGDMRTADQLAERAYVLAKELQSGK
jgi:hypothetical protein